VYQAGTLSGNPVATTAGLATLRLADADVYRRIDEASAQVRALVAEALGHAGVPHRIQSAGNLFSVFLGVQEPVNDFEAAKTQETWRFSAFFPSPLHPGVYLPPSAFEAWFVSAAHGADDGDEALSRLAQALPDAARAAATAAPESTTV